jgi:hypothetical protein
LKLTGCKIYENELVEIAKRLTHLHEIEISNRKASATITAQNPEINISFVEFKLDPASVVEEEYRLSNSDLEITEKNGIKRNALP